jgi:hypothetical protein
MSLYNENDQRLQGYYKTAIPSRILDALITVPVAELRLIRYSRQFTQRTNHTGAPWALGIGITIHGRDLVAAEE